MTRFFDDHPLYAQLFFAMVLIAACILTGNS
jgi:hypothetical protein